MSDDGSSWNEDENNRGDQDKIGGGRLSRLNAYFETLVDPYRRRTLYYLNEHRPETITIDELARYVAALETDYSPETLVEADYADVRQELYHNHLPRLADYGIVDYDPRSGDVRFRQPSGVLLALLRVSQLIERPPK